MNIGDTVKAPSIRGTITRMVSYGIVESIMPTKTGKIVYVRLRYGQKINQVLPFQEHELNTHPRIYR